MSIVEVAAKAGVSISTVSRVINNRPRVSPQAELAVRAAMKELQYSPKPNRPGPKLRPRVKAQITVALLAYGLPDVTTLPAFSDLVKGVTIGADELGVHFIFHQIRDPGVIPSFLAENKVDGILLHATHPDTATQKVFKAYPTVWLMGNRFRPQWGDQVMTDPYEIGVKAAKFLQRNGHKSVAYLNLDQGHWPFRVASQAFRVTATDARLTCAIVERATEQNEYVDWLRSDVRIGDELVQQFLALANQPTGLFIADDLQVAVLQPSLLRAGVVIGTRCVPGEVEVISCNNERSYLIGLSPKPAEIDIHALEVGQRGIERLVWRIKNAAGSCRMVTAIYPSVVDHHGHPIEDLQSD